MNVLATTNYSPIGRPQYFARSGFYCILFVATGLTPFFDFPLLAQPLY